jgi:hypothetical protein
VPGFDVLESDIQVTNLQSLCKSAVGATDSERPTEKLRNIAGCDISRLFFAVDGKDSRVDGEEMNG